MAEELRLDQLARERGAVELLERPLRARAERVDGAGDELLAGSALARDQHAGGAPGGAPDLLDQALHRAALADEIARAPGRAPQVAGLGLGPRQAQSGVDRDEERVGVEGLLEEIERTDAHGAHGGVDVGVAAHHDDGRVVLARAQPLEELDAVAVGQHHVEEAEVVGALLQLFLGDLDAAGDVDRVPLERQGLLQRREDRRLVVHDEEVRERHRVECSGSGRGAR